MVNGKQKGSSFEREACVAFSLWLSKGQHKDLLWRSAMSGGRATVSRGTVRQAGDICAVAPEGHILTDRLYLECKHLRDISLDSLIKGKGPLLEIWKKTKEEAAKYTKVPVLVFRQNHYPTVVCTNKDGIQFLDATKLVLIKSRDMCLLKFDDLMKTECKL